MGHVLGAEVPAFNDTSKAFTFGGTSNVYFFNVSENVYFQLRANSQVSTFAVVQTEFPQTAASFYFSFGEMASFSFSQAACLFNTGSYLNSGVTVSFQSFQLGNTVGIYFNNSHWN
eukprot:RCo012864